MTNEPHQKVEQLMGLMDIVIVPEGDISFVPAPTKTQQTGH
jgi:hypothetical protein